MLKKLRLYLNSFILIVLGVIAFQALSFCISLPAHAELAAPQLIRVGYVTNEKNSDLTHKDGENGYSYDYLHEIAQYYNWELKFVPVTAKSSIRSLRDGRVNLLIHVHYKENLEKFIDYSTKEAGTCRVGLYVLKKNENIVNTGLTSSNVRRIGRFAPKKNIRLLERFISENDIKATYINFDNPESLVNALIEGSVDEALISGNDIPPLLKIIKLFPEDPFYFAVAEGNQELLSKIDSAMQNILLMDPSFTNHLFKKHFGKYLSWESVLTLEEKEFIERAPVLVASYDPLWHPLEYYDKEKKQMAGINANILGLIEEYSGLRIKISPSPTREEAMRRMCEGEIDILTGVNRSFVWGAKNNFRLTRPFLNAPIVMVMNRENTYAGQRIALPKDYFLSEEVKSFHKFDKTVYLESQEACFNALTNNKVSATFANSYIANYLISLPRYSNLYTINYGRLREEVSMGISKKCDPILISIINKALNSIPEETVNGIIIGHSFSKERTSFIDMIYTYHIELAKGITVFLILLLFTMTIITISKSIDKKNLEKLLYNDPLTGLKNYNSFLEDVPRIIKQNPNTNFAVLLIDIVEFKVINRSFGYEEGDKVLKNVSMMLDGKIDRSKEAFARIFADHFVLLLSYEKFESINIRIKMLLSELKKVSQRNKDYNLIFNGGVYMIVDLDIPINIAVDNASFAKNTIKEKHKTAYTYYDKKILSEIKKEKIIESSMRAALRNGEFIPYLQPKIDCYTGKAVGAEALVRWVKPDGEVILPEMFIPYFEKSGFITKIDMYIFSETCRILRKWLDGDRSVFPVSCNFSYVDIKGNNFTENLKMISQRHNVPPELLQLELTESVAVEHMETVDSFGNKLSKYGFKLSIDDFGAGYSSLSLLQILKIDVIKLDKTFVQRGLKGKLAGDLVRNTVKTFKENSIQVVFEGIETKEQVGFVKSLGGRIIQGYYYSEPLPLSEFEEKYLN